MHIISRSANEGLVINGNIRVTVLEVGRTSVRLQIEDPAHQPVVREEMLYFEEDGGTPPIETAEPTAHTVTTTAAL